MQGRIRGRVYVPPELWSGLRILVRTHYCCRGGEGERKGQTHAVLVLGVLGIEVLEEADLDEGLVVEGLAVLDDFDGNILAVA